MKKIIMLNFCNGLYGGIESFLLNAFYCLDHDKYQVTFLTCGKSTYEMFRDDIIKCGGMVDEIPVLAVNTKNKVEIYKRLVEYFKKNNPDVVHINSGTLSLNYLASLAARKANVKNIIVHSHNFRPYVSKGKNLVRVFLKYAIERNANSYLACSKGAANWMFSFQKVDSGEVQIIPNGIDTKKFQYSEKKRNDFRKELNLSSELVIGNIGRFQGQKNHMFMVEIMREVVKVNPKVVLLLVGDGELKTEVMHRVNDYKLDNNILFLGERKDIDSFLSAIDIFIFPSIYEGFGIAAIEAEASGAKVLASDRVPQDTNLNGKVVYLPIDTQDAVKLWANEINRCNDLSNREKSNILVREKGFDVHTCYERLFCIYER